MKVRLTCGCPINFIEAIVPHDKDGWIIVPVTLEQALGGRDKMPICKACGQRVVEHVEGQ